MKKLGLRTKGPETMAALAGVVSAAVVLAVAELIGAFFTARATPVFALGSTFIDFTPPWMKDFAIATFGTNDKAALFVGMGLTIALLACVLGVVAYKKWALGVLGVLFMGAVIVAAVLTRAGVGPADAIPSVLGTIAGLIVLRRLIKPLWGLKAWPEAPADVAADADSQVGGAGTSRRRFFPGPARRRPDRIARHPHLRIQPGGRKARRKCQMAGHAHPRSPGHGQT
jgi:hypothetical protein